MKKNVHNIVLIGETGNGKSSLGNFCSGYEAFEVSDDCDSCTKDTFQKISKLDPEIGIVDTPGLQDSDGADKIHYDKMLEIFEGIDIHFIVVVLNFTNPRFTASIKFMLKFLCNVFPKNFALHLGIVFTHYHHEYQLKITKNKKDPQESKNKYVQEIMNLIEKCTGEKSLKKPPVFFLDSYIEDDDYSKRQLNNLLAFAKFLNPIENIRTNCDIRFKKKEEESKTIPEEKVEGNSIVTYYKKYKRIVYTDYNDNITYGDWELVDTQTSNRPLPVVEKKEIVYRERDDSDDDKKSVERSNINKNDGDDDNTLLKDFFGLAVKAIVGAILFKDK